VYRVAHNAATSHGIRRWANAPRLVSLDEIDDPAEENDFERAAHRRMSMERLLGLIQTLKPIDRQVVLLYLEGLDAASIDRERSRRSIVFMASGTVILPSWLAVAWYFPDFRLLASVGVATALWILYQVYRNTADRRVPAGVAPAASLHF
jgi:hypothetical protein